MADPASTPLGKMLLEEITPVVMVLCTPYVEESCLKNGLSLIQLLSPFCDFTNIDVPVRTASDQPYRLRKFKLRLFYSSDIRQPNLEVAKERLKKVITHVGEKNFRESSDPSQVNNLLSRPESEMLPSWFQFFNKELVRTLSFSDHEAFDHPVACLLVVSSKDDEPVNRFVDLFNTNKLPSLLNDGAMDPKIMKHYLLLHDNQDGPFNKATKLLADMRNAFGQNDCQIICFNSSQDGKIHHQDNPWAPFKSDALPTENLGCFLNLDDLNEIKDFMQELSSKHIIPYMEQKIRVLNQQVSATRKGFRNQIKNLWWRKGKEDTIDTPNGPVYTFNSIESQIRILGDYAFMLGDYELALSNYRLISTDYKLDKAWKRYAGVQKLGSAGRRNATRCGLWWAEMLKTRDQLKEAATVYFRICGEDTLHSAVMLEQASFCYLLSKPPMLHKYGFHLVLSGDHYKKCDQIKHAIRTYRSAIPVYKGTTWSLIKDHVHFHIGQWYALLGMYDVAVTHMLEVLASTHQSKTTQELFLRDFLQIVQKTGKTFEVLKLQLPVINISSLKVIFEDQRTNASAAAASVKESLWRSLEEDMIPSSTARSNWLELQSKIIPRKYKESNICVAGEALKVDTEFKNPLQIPISVSSVSLMCELSANPEEGKLPNSSNEVQNNEDRTSTSSGDINSCLILSEVDFSLEGGETTVVQLTVTPRIEGILKIVGVKWKLSSAVVGLCNFEFNSVNKRVVRGRRKQHSPSSDLKFLVIKSLPRLEGFIHSLPEKTYAGDLRPLVLELSNQSKFPVKNLKMKISNPRFLYAGNQKELNADFPACLKKKMNVEKSGSHANVNKTLQNLFHFPEDIFVQEETSLSWPLWFHAAVPGNIPLYITIYYEMEGVSSIMKYRTLRMHYNLQVLPSLDVSFQLSTRPSRSQEFLLRMDVVNKTSSECFQVHQLSSVGQQWEISLLQPVDSILPSQSLFAGQSLSCFFMLKDRRRSSTSDDSIPSISHIQSDVRLGPQDNSEAFFDVSSSPLADFHDCERSSQGMSSQGCEYKVDFVFIAQLPEGNSDSSSNTPLVFSHHACDCSPSSMSPISWLVDGPRTIQHNFSAPLCEVNLKMTITNSSDAIASVHINTFDSPSSNNQPIVDATTSQPPEHQSGWSEIPIVNDTKIITTEALTTRVPKSLSLESVPQFIWSGTSSTKLVLQPRSTAESPLQICVFTPGIYDLSNYVLNWNLTPVNDGENQGEANKSSGVCQGYPYYLSVLESNFKD
ncbi:trafficking protein particle complex subunit 8-like [Gossypium australe]|uniref:Trafficking protein particle complex subunit 8-like n=1 Tax=Gossypium australe TaxID=47621 RepID=A0A5B6VSW5_9ROSI|nr:trafficking protein particle complex subunit 8-like [Gossypium australe]